jgi:electron transfer flavoprotein beta subunit
MTGLVLLQAGVETEPAISPRGDNALADPGGGGAVIPNPGDRAALECALALAPHVLALTVGPVEHECALRLGRARGVSGTVRLWDPALATADAAAMARVLAAAVAVLGPAVILAGVRGLEGATGAIPPLLAARLGWPCLDGVSRLRREGDHVVGERAASGGRREEVEAVLPAVVTVRAGSAAAPYVPYRARRLAARESIETWNLARLGLEAATVRGWIRSRVEAVDWPRPRPRRTATPPPAKAAADRLRQLTSGGAKPPTRESRLIEGPPDDVARQLLAFLAASGFLGSAPAGSVRGAPARAGAVTGRA